MEMLLKIWVLRIISFVSIVPLFLHAHTSSKDYLKIHNDARAEVGVEPLKWDSELERYAHKFVKQHVADCRKALTDESFSGKYGQNIAYSSASTTGIGGVNLWVSQKKNYNYNSNSCFDGSMTCFTYVEIVWETITSVACDEINCHDYGGTLVTCLYYPIRDFSKRPFIIH
ncbi:hypothetical protein PIB30_046295 [Stylosanthes scabra]|uniref:SCP domain-containing protein n=1 Tax=Stylosanthes scabra TaxID=79078 RepID=A0ABU6QH06_9FABA|nr:hypothetical protein [Stylosanthes scabra]